MHSIYEYTNYRNYLKDTFALLREKNPSFSYRFFNRKAGFSSSGFVKHVIESDKNLGPEGIRKICQGLGLSNQEAEYFESLVQFNQSDNHQNKDIHFKKLLKHKNFLKKRQLETIHYHLLSRWYYVGILELMRVKTESPITASWLYSKLTPRVELKKLKQAIKELKQAGLLVEEENGELTRKDVLLSTPDEVQSVSVVNYHLQMSDLAQQALKECPDQDREFSGLTIALSQKGFEEAKQEIRAFRKKLHSILEAESDQKSNVTQINLQVFKLIE